MKKEYLEMIEETFLENDPEEIGEVIYDLYDTVIECYRQANRQCFFTKRNFVETFCRLYEDLGGEVFEITPPTFAKCVSQIIDDANTHFVQEDIDEMGKTVWPVFA